LVSSRAANKGDRFAFRGILEPTGTALYIVELSCECYTICLGTESTSDSYCIYSGGWT